MEWAIEGYCIPREPKCRKQLPSPRPAAYDRSFRIQAPDAAMPEITFPYHAVWQELDSGLLLGEALLFPDLSRLARDRERGGKRVAHNLALRLPKEPAGELYRRAAPDAVEVVEV